MFRFLRCGMIQHYYDITRVRCKVHERRGRRDGASDLPGVLSSLRGAAGYLCTISSVPRHRSPSFRSRSRAGRDGARLRRRRPSPRRRVHLRVKLSRHLVVRRFRLRGGVLRRIGRRVSAVSGGALTLRSLCLRLGLLRHPRELDRLFRRDLRGRRLFGGDASRGGGFAPLARASALASAAAATAAGAARRRRGPPSRAPRARDPTRGEDRRGRTACGWRTSSCTARTAPPRPRRSPLLPTRRWTASSRFSRLGRSRWWTTARGTSSARRGACAGEGAAARYPPWRYRRWTSPWSWSCSLSAARGVLSPVGRSREISRSKARGCVG